MKQGPGGFSKALFLCANILISELAWNTNPIFVFQASAFCVGNPGNRERISRGSALQSLALIEKSGAFSIFKAIPRNSKCRMGQSDFLPECTRVGKANSTEGRPSCDWQGKAVRYDGKDANKSVRKALAPNCAVLP